MPIFHLLTELTPPIESVAKFELTPSTTPPTSTSSWKVAVSHPGAIFPFFSATISPLPIGLSAIKAPFNNTWLGSLFSYIQPPFSAGEAQEESASGVEGKEGHWAFLAPVMKGLYHLSVGAGALSRSETDGQDKPKLGDGVGFPDLKPYSLVMATNNFDLVFPDSRWETQV